MPNPVHASQRVALWHEKAASILVAARCQGAQVERLPVELRPSTVDEGFAVQQKVSDVLGRAIGAWKCALPTAGKVIAAPICADLIYRSVECSFRARSVQSTVKAEPELACFIKRDLPPRRYAYGEAEVLDALGDVHLALELLGSRYSQPASLTFPELLADGLFNAGLVIGPRVEFPDGGTPDHLPAEFTISLTAAGEAPVRLEGRHPDGNVLSPIVWLANFLRERGLGLQAGQAVITGSYAGALELPLGRQLDIGFGALGVLPICFRFSE
ncbi:2-keto-4-pentenoate hydratase [Paraburkholderia strydomiana]|uniref:2-keto-4-pentenoate hydratase n=1 Tax=Paraburkholderia strydomiana TaxID=1245417 RepID=UPI001BE5D0EE|nr:2-keto-4-pentenoate hydratase [Paraburkholderia strydomiana]MBT2794804.1 2-keto-4-pentenoate hydratase [Paraburkholderia strydomiana]